MLLWVATRDGEWDKSPGVEGMASFFQHSWQIGEAGLSKAGEMILKISKQRFDIV